MKLTARDAAAAWEKIRGLLPRDTDSHAVVTLLLPDGARITIVDTDTRGTISIDDPEAILEAFHLIDHGQTIVIVVRSDDEDISHWGPGGLPVPFKTVRAWVYEHGASKPIGAETLQLSYLTAPGTGEPLDPEPDVRFASAWPITGEPHGARPDPR